MDTIPQDIPQKQCHKCGQSFPATPDFFQRNRAMRDGLLNQCKPCCSTAKPKEIPEGYKRCSKCKEVMPASHEFFYSHRHKNVPMSWSDLDSWCIKCVLERDHAKRPRHAVLAVPEGWKYCPACQTAKPADSFYLLRGVANGRCKLCRSDAKRKRIHVSRGPMKRCTRCLQEHPATGEFFPRLKASSDGLDSRCRPCMNVLLAQRREQNRNRINQKQRAYRAADRENFNEQSKIYYYKRKARKAGSGGTYTLQEIREQLERQKYKCYYCHQPFEKVHTQNGIKYKYHIEHVIPFARGGRNDIWNIVLACPTCNLHKHDKLPHEWPEGGRLL